MKFSIITVNRNGARFLEEALCSVLSQRVPGVGLEYIVLDGGSTDGSLSILKRYESELAHLVCGPDGGPAAALNRGFSLATGEVIAWLNADDRYHPGALKRVAGTMSQNPDRGIAFGGCGIIDESGREIRKPITRFKEFFFPLSCRFAIQCLNYVSQPATFFRRRVLEEAGNLRTDLRAAWDYDLWLRLWRRRGAVRVPGATPLADFRWHPGSISGTHFGTQFREEYEAAARDAGRFSPQALIHFGVHLGIIGAYRLMTRRPSIVGADKSFSPLRIK